MTQARERLKLALGMSAIVLVGGKSLRMGQDKALLEIAGQTFLQRVCDVARQYTDVVYVVTPWTERYRELLNDRDVLIEEKIFSSDRNSGSPITGLIQGLQVTQQNEQTEWILLLACDLPLLHAEMLESWMRALLSVDEAVNVLLPRNPQGWWEPLCGFYRQRCLSSLQQFVNGGGRSFQQWLQQQAVQELQGHDPARLLNCNTPEDLARLQQYPLSP